MENPIQTAKAAFNLNGLIKLLFMLWILGLVAGALGLWNWLFNPWGALINKFPSLAKFSVNSGG